MKENIKIKDLKPEFRPDEKFMKFGAESLNDAELLAIILRTGSSSMNSVELAEKVLHRDNVMGGSVLGIFDYEIEDLLKIRGIGSVKAIQIKAIAELSKRIAQSYARPELNFSNPEKIAFYYMEQLRHLKNEVVILLLLNSACDLIKEIKISEGTVNSSLFSPREIFIYALKYEAVNLILLHNHPSGLTVPSEADILGTQRVCEAGKLMGINLLDHIIIGDNSFCSLRSEGCFNLNN